MSPDCGHRYERPGEHQVTVTAHWDVEWTATGGTAAPSLRPARPRW